MDLIFLCHRNYTSRGILVYIQVFNYMEFAASTSTNSPISVLEFSGPKLGNFMMLVRKFSCFRPRWPFCCRCISHHNIFSPFLSVFLRTFEATLTCWMMDMLQKLHLNLNKNTLYILSLLQMFPDKGFFTWKWDLGCSSIVIQILAPFMQSVYYSAREHQTTSAKRSQQYEILCYLKTFSNSSRNRWKSLCFQRTAQLIRVRITWIMLHQMNLMNCCPARIHHRFLWCTIVGVILHHWPGSLQKTHSRVNAVIIQNT